MANYFLFFDDFETLDMFGPVEILSKTGAGLHYVSMNGGPVRSRQGYEVLTEAAAGIGPGGVLLIPGGWGTRALVKDEAFLTKLKGLCESAGYVLTVCTGSALLAKTGLLDGRCATSNKKALDWVKSVSDEVMWDPQARWVSDGKYWTSSGVAAGTDMALAFVSHLYGEEKAGQIAKDIEYLRN